ncbi:hypothetical protein CT0861_02180, partial [Colletotrichum tofieldiae]
NYERHSFPTSHADHQEKLRPSTILGSRSLRAANVPSLVREPQSTCRFRRVPLTAPAKLIPSISNQPPVPSSADVELDRDDRKEIPHRVWWCDMSLGPSGFWGIRKGVAIQNSARPLQGREQLVTVIVIVQPLQKGIPLPSGREPICRCCSLAASHSTAERGSTVPVPAPVPIHSVSTMNRSLCKLEESGRHAHIWQHRSSSRKPACKPSCHERGSVRITTCCISVSFRDLHIIQVGSWGNTGSGFEGCQAPSTNSPAAQVPVGYLASRVPRYSAM